MSPRLVIIGGVAGGMSAATRARRLDERASIIVLEQGSFVSFANCGMPYYLARRIPKKENLLLTNPKRLQDRFRISARIGHTVTKIDRPNHQVEGIDSATGRRFVAPYDKLIIATGAKPLTPPIASANAKNVFSLRSMEDMLAIDDAIEQGASRVVIVGAGFIGLELAEALHERDRDVTIIEKAPTVLPIIEPELARLVQDELLEKGITLHVGTGLRALHAENGLVKSVETESGQRIEADLVILALGVRPDSKIATDAGLKLGATGAIAVDQFQRTSDPDIYAVGDVAESIHRVTGKPVRIPLAGPANRQGRLAGEHAVTGNAPPAGKLLGSAIVQVFKINVALTGLTEKAAREAGFEADSAYIVANNHSGYYPGGRQMLLKLIYDNATGRILGAQAVGGPGVDKRIDVIATAMHFGGTINDLTALDLVYAPQFSSAKDPVHIAAFVAQNQRAKLTTAVPPNQRNGETLIDVRTPEEFAKGSLPNARNIPLDVLRNRLNELDRNAPTLVLCQVGQRGYAAQRLLTQKGFASVKNIKGGYTLARNLPQ